jgi:hypothetical protein
MWWRTAGLCLVSLVGLTGCPETFGRDGAIDQAAHEDALERIRPECSAKDRRKYCGDGRENSAECLKYCGGP